MLYDLPITTSCSREGIENRRRVREGLGLGWLQGERPVCLGSLRLDHRDLVVVPKSCDTFLSEG